MKLDPSVTQVHSADYRNPQALPDGPVLVVGGGNSGLQIAEELAATRPVEVSVGENPPMLPQRLLGKDLLRNRPPRRPLSHWRAALAPAPARGSAPMRRSQVGESGWGTGRS